MKTEMQDMSEGRRDEKREASIEKKSVLCSFLSTQHKLYDSSNAAFLFLRYTMGIKLSILQCCLRISSNLCKPTQNF